MVQTAPYPLVYTAHAAAWCRHHPADRRIGEREGLSAFGRVPMGKFALRGLAQSMARELAPKGIHVAHFVIDGGVRNVARDRIEGANASPDSYLDPDAIAESYMHVVKQPRSAWTWEVELRPWVERF
jgi:NAD(P)-dependent dehydrogenase (short-subunit alcohol dehydrogenase family)